MLSTLRHLSVRTSLNSIATRGISTKLGNLSSYPLPKSCNLITHHKRSFSIKNVPEETIEVDLSKLSFKEQRKCLTLLDIVKNYGAGLAGKAAAVYIGTFVLAYLLVSGFNLSDDIIKCVTDICLYMKVENPLSRIDFESTNTQTATDLVVAFFLSDLLDIVVFPLFFIYAVSFIRRSGKPIRIPISRLTSEMKKKLGITK